MINMEFREFIISELCDIKSGKRLPKGKDFVDRENGFNQYIRSRNVKNGKIMNDDIPYIDKDTFEKIKKYIINAGDIAITIVANIGDVGICPFELSGFNLTENCAKLTNFIDCVNSRYLNYYLSQSFMKEYMFNRSIGAAQAKLGLSKIAKIIVCLPELDIQTKIVDIVLKYDQLIENNNSRIKVLESIAEELYKEWFVRFRFAGYESVQFENGIPKGWKLVKLNDIALEVDKPINRENRYQYKYYVPIECLPNKSMGLVDVDNIENAESSLISFQKKNILFGAMRPYFHKVIYSPIEGITRTTCFVLDAKNDLYREWLYLTMYQKFTVDFANTVSVGSTMPYVRWKDLNRMKICLPSKDIIAKFNILIQPILNKINSYFDINKNLIKQRDSLLPRLMSGKLSVEGKEII